MLSAVLFLLVLTLSKAIYEDELGQHEWHLQHFGLSISASIFSSKALVVSTKQGVLSRVDPSTGKFLWRLMLDAPADAMVGNADMSVVFTLSHEGRVARAWSNARGNMLWETPLFANGTQHQLFLPGTQDMTVTPRGDVLVLSNNQLIVLSPQNGAVKTQYKDNEGLVVLGHFVASANKDMGSTGASVVRVVAGCKAAKSFVSAEAFGAATCSAPVVLEFDQKSNVIAAKTIQGKVMGVPTSVRGVMTYDAEQDFGPHDTLISVTSSAAKANKYSVIMLATGTPFEVSVGKGFDADFSVAALRYRDADGAAMVATQCSSATTQGGLVERTCKAVKLDAGAKASDPLLQCSGAAASLSFGMGHTTSEVAGSVTCSSSPTGSSTIEHKRTILPSNAITTHTVSPSNAVQGFKAARSTDSSVLIMSSSGSLVMSNKDEVVWEREEALSSVQSVVIVDHVDPSVVEDVLVESSVPSLENRLQMQYKELTDLVGKTTASVLSTPAKLLSIAASPSTIVKYFKKATAEKTREEKDSEAVTFGFDKLAVAVTCADNQPTLQDAGVKVVAINHVHGEVLWTFEPDLSAFQDYLPFDTIYRADSAGDISYNTKLLVTRPHPFGQMPAEITLLLSVTTAAKSYTFFYTINPHTGETANKTCGPSSVLPKHVMDVFAVKELASPQSNAYIISTHGDDNVVLYNANTTTATGGSIHWHSLDESTGVLRTYRLSGVCRADEQFTTCASVDIASAVFGADQESIASSSAPTIHDTLHSKVVVMGDDSLLLKYINPHIRVVVTSRKAVGDEASLLTVNVVDTVSAKIVYRAILEDAEGPVHSSIVENNLVVTYWNGKAKRSELSSISLYEGMIDKHGLGPYGFSSGKHARLSEAAAQPFSSYTHNLPIAMNKTYILPKPVVGVDHTVSARGITNKQFVVALDNGQIYLVDRRQIEPRRPINPPLPREKSEGLAQYTPFLFLSPMHCITYNSTVATGRTMDFTAVASQLESTGSVLASGLDMYFTRVRPSQEFDLLASDFNHPLLLLILVGMAFGTWKLRDMSRNKALRSAWR